MDNTVIENVNSAINSNAKYWMVRTMGGDYYKEFVEDGYIAVGYNEITLNDLRKLPESDKLSRDILMALLKDRNEKLKNVSYPVSQLIRFYRDMNVGDFIVVPSKNSHYVSFGIISSDIYEEEGVHLHSAELCPFSKRRRVDWKTSSIKNRLAPVLQLMFGSRHIISDVDDYAPYIDSLLSDFYVKDDEANLVLRINTPDEIRSSDFFAIYKVFQIVDEFCKEKGLDVSTSDIIMKVQMQSAGDVRLSSKQKFVLALVGLTVYGIIGGGLKLDIDGIGLKLDLSSNGFLHEYSDFLDRSVDRKTKESINTSMKSLAVDSIKDLEIPIKLLQEQNSIRNNY